VFWTILLRHRRLANRKRQTTSDWKKGAKFYRADTRFAVETEQGYEIYPCRLLVAELKNGERFVYDLVDVKEPTLSASAGSANLALPQGRTEESASSTGSSIANSVDGAQGGRAKFYVDKTQARQISTRLAREAFDFGKSEVQFLSFPRTSNVIHSIADFGSPVKGAGVQKDSQQFKRWFGDSKKDPAGASKIVDENGEPLRVYRGAEFDPLAEEADKGVIKPEAYFTADQNYAKRYAGSEGAVSAYYLNIRHPFDIRDPECQKDFESVYPGQKLARGKSGALDWAEAATIDGEFLE